MTPPHHPTNPNSYIDADQLSFSASENVVGATKGYLFEYDSRFSDNQFLWRILLGFAYNESNDLIAQHSGETVYHHLSVGIYTVYNGQTSQLNLISETFIASQASNFDENDYTIYPWRTLASDDGRYFITVDSMMDNGTHSLPYDNYCHFDVFLDDDYYFKYIDNIVFDGNIANVTNYKINITNDQYLMLNIPVEWMNWTEVEINTINCTLISNPAMYQDIAKSASIYELANINYDFFEHASWFDEIGNYTFGFGACTDQDYVPIYLSLNELFPDQLGVLNITFIRIPTKILLLTKETKVKLAGGAPGFDWIFTISGIGILVLFLKKKRIY
jgi:hypothetical protein